MWQIVAASTVAAAAEDNDNIDDNCGNSPIHKFKYWKLFSWWVQFDEINLHGTIAYQTWDRVYNTDVCWMHIVHKLL